MSKLLEGLNSSQREAVTHKNGPLLIIAGPGSGKTRTIACSIAYAIENLEVDPSKIAAFTFTNKAKNELKNRVSDFVVKPDIVNDVWISTFHSFCGHVWNNHPGKLVIKNERDSSAEELKHIYIDYLQYHKFADSKEILNSIRQWEKAVVSSTEISNQQNTRICVDVYKKQRQIRKNSDDIYTRVQLFTNALLRDVPEVKTKWQDRFELIFVDEFQDTDHIQYEIIKALAGEHPNLRVVGDGDQSIYGRRGADSQNILNFKRDYPNAKITPLGQNYRSTQRMVETSCAFEEEVESQRKRGFSPFLERGYIPTGLLESVEVLKNIPIPPSPEEMVVQIDPEETTEYVEPLPEQFLGSGMTVIGVDPGNIGAKKTTNVGWSVTRKVSDGHSVLDHNTEHPTGEKEDRLKQIEHVINRLVKRYRLDAIAVEKLEISTEASKEDWFYYVAGCVAAIRAIADQHGIECRLYTPQQVKYAATGNKQADKEQVEQGVKKRSNLKKVIKTDHEADAIAASLCYLRSHLNAARFEGNKQKQECYRVGCDYLNNGQYEAAATKFKEAINIDPIYTEAYCGLGRACLAQGNLDTAEDAAKKVLRLTENNHSDTQGELVKAEKFANDLKQIYYERGTIAIEDRDWNNAIDDLQKASDIDPNDKDVWTNLGRAYYWLDDYANAVSCYQKAANLDPKDKTIYNNLGNAYYWIGEYEKAVGSFQKASELNPNCEKTYYYLARVYFKLENLDAAELAVEKALHIAPNYQEATELLGDIKLAADYKMVRIPAGEFQMGSNNSEAKDHEKPVHIVYVDEFYIDIHPVTNTEYKAFIDANPEWQKDHISRGDYLKHWNGNNYPQGKGNHPVTYMNWYAAMAYAQWTGKRLLTEAEWEKAARGGLTGQTYQSEDFMNASKANYNHAVAGTISVRTYPPNNYGLYDMTGNVREWCLDEYNSDFYKNSPRRNPMAGSNNIDETINSFKDVRTSRVLRGNSWRFIRQSVQVTRRFDYPPMYATDDIGFRCAKSVIG